MKWEYVALGDLYEVHNGLSKGGRFFGDGFPFLSFSTVFNKWFLPQELPDLVQSTDKEQQSYSIQRGDVFVTRTSETMDELGMSSVALKDYPHATYNGFTKRLRPINSERILPEFIGYYLRTPFFRAGFAAFSTMTTRASLRNEDLLSMKVPVPDIPTQKRIANILSAYDNLIENDQKQIKLLEEAAQRLYKEWFVDLRFPGHENTKITDGIPEGWEYKPIFDVFDFVRGRSYTSNELSDSTGILMVNLKNIRAFGGYNRNAEKRFVGQFKDNQILSAGDVIMGVTDMTQERRLVGHVALVPNMGETMIFSMDLIKLIPKRTDNLFLYSAMIFGGVSKRISPLANGVNVLHLKPEAIMGVEMLIPNDKVVCQYHSQMAPVFSEIETLQKQCDIAAEARDRLLSKLMNGEKRGG